MSTTIDQKIVEMKFDNSNFERNTKTTMSTLDKLKAKLNFKGATDSLEDLTDASEKLNFKQTQNGIQQVSMQFSAMYAVATRIFERLTDQAINLAKSMSIDQVTAGFEKYANETAAVQTIMSATGKDIDTVSAQLERLSWFTDETSYNFTDMVDNIGKFTSAGIDLEVAVTAMEGIANWAAISGQTAGAASRAMYNLSQSMGAGYLALMDWKSIELANMATMQFKNNLLETAEAMGAITKAGEDASGVMEYMINGTDKTVSYKNLRETLSEKWVTNDILMAVLNEYGAYSNAVQMVQDRLEIGTASETMRYIEQFMRGNQIKGTEADLLAIADAMNLTKEEAQALYDTYNSTGKAAFAAAQEAKTWADAVGATKDAVSSQWMGIFRTIFGDYQEAKILFTDLANEMWNVFAGPLEGLHEELTTAFNHKSEWKDIVEALDEGGISAERFQEAIVAADEGATHTYKGVEYTLSELIDKFGSLEKVSENGYVSFGLLTKTLYSLGTSVTELGPAAEGFYKVIEKGGRIKLIESIANTYGYLKSVLGAIGQAWQNAFPISISERISKFIDRFFDFSQSLKLTEEQSSAITKTFEGMFSVFRTVSGVLSTIIGGIYSVARTVLPYVVGFIMQVASTIGTYISDFAQGFETVAKYISENAKTWWDSIANSKTVQTIKGYFKQVTDAFKSLIDKIFGGISGVKLEQIGTFFDNLGSSFLGLFGSILSSEPVQKAGAAISGFINNISDAVRNFRLPSLNEIVGAIGGFFKSFSSNNQIMGGIQKGTVSGFIEVLQGLFSKKIYPVKTSVINTITEAYKDSGSVLSKAIEWARNLIHDIAQFVGQTVAVSVKTIYGATKNILALAEMFGAFKLMMSASGVLDAIKARIRGESGGVGSVLSGLVELLKTIGIVVGEMVALVLLLGKLEQSDPEMIQKGFNDLSNVLVALGLLATFMVIATHGTTEGAIKGTALTIVAIGVAIGMIADAIVKIQDVKFNPLGLLSLFGVLYAVFRFMSGLKGVSIGGALPLIALASGLSMLLDTIQKYSDFDWQGNIVGLTMILPMLLLMTTVMKSLSGVQGLSSMAFISLALSMKLILNVIESLGNMPGKVLAKGLASLTFIMLIVVGLTKLIDIVTKGSGISFTATAKIGTFIGLMLLIVTLAAAVALLGKLPTEQLVKGVGAVTVLIAAISGLLIALSKVSAVNTWQILATLVGVGLIMAALMFMYDKWLSKIDYTNWVSAVGTLGALMTELVLFTAAIGLLGHIDPATLTLGLFNIGLVTAFVGAMVALVTAIMVELGSDPGMVSKLENAVVVAGLIGNVIGSLIGGFVGGIAGGAVSAFALHLEMAADSLSAFAEKIKPFMEFVTSIGSEESSKSSLFMESLGTLLGGLSDISSWFGSKLDRIPVVGSKLNSFMKNLNYDGSFFNGLKKVEPSQIEAAKTIGEIVKAFGDLEGSYYNGNVDTLSEDLVNYVGAISSLVVTLRDGNRKYGYPALPTNAMSIVEPFKSVALEVINLFNNLPDSGGFFSWFSGTKSWSTVGTDLTDFAGVINKFANTLKWHGYDDSIKSKAKSFMEIADLVITEFNKLPREGDFFEQLLGKRDWSSIGQGLEDFVGAMDGFAKYVNDLDSDESYQNAIAKVKEMLNLGNVINEINLSDGGATKLNLQNMVASYIQTISTSITTYGQKLRSSGEFMVVYIKDGFTRGITDMVTTSTSVIIEKFNTQFSLRAGTLRNIGATAVTQIASGMTKENTTLYDTARAVCDQIISALNGGGGNGKSLYARFYESGEYAATGLADGLYSYKSKSKVWTAGSKLGNHALDALNYSVSIASPSKKFRESGEFSAEGYVLGITDSLGSVTKATSQMGDASIAGMNTAISRIGDSLDSTNSFSNQPVIRPVLDLTDVTNGANQMRGILTDDYNLALSGSVTSSRLSNSIKNQNGGNTMADAIASLKDDFTTMTNEIKGMKIVMDSGAVVGSISSKMDKALGTISTYKGRGNTY